jgi:phosphatidylinositol-3-phosphatase
MDSKWKLGRLAAGLIALLGVPSFLACVPTMATAEALPKPQHVFIIVLENEGYDVTFGPKSPAIYLNALARKGALLENYYGIGHYSLDNYIAMISGQAPNPVTQSDCSTFDDFRPKDDKGKVKIDEHGQALGRGCVYPKNVLTIIDQLTARQGLTWKGYMEDMGNDPGRGGGTACAHPEIDAKDNTHKAVKGDQYAARHNPFMYFHSVIDDRHICDAHVVNLSHLAKDLEKLETTPNYVFITPNLCHDGHDEPCVDNEPGGLISADRFLMQYVPMILNSLAFDYDQAGKYNGGLLIVTFDEAETEDATSCCNEPRGPNIKDGDKVFGSADKGPGVYGPGGGRIGAVLVSRYIKEGTVSKSEYNHYSLLRSIEDFFDLEHLGYAGQKGLNSFGADVFTKPSGKRY